MFTPNTKPSPELLKAVRAGLIAQGSSLSRWADEHAVKRQNLTKAVIGQWTGPRASQLVQEVVQDAMRGFEWSR